MPSYDKCRIDTIEFSPELGCSSLPLCIDDMSLAFHLGIRNKSLWYFVLNSDELYRVFSIPKRGGSKGRRQLQVPDRRLAVVQTCVMQRFLYALPKPGKHVGAYVPGRTIKDTSQQHVGQRVLISMDIKDFFPSTRRHRIKAVFNDLGYPNRVSSMLASLVTYKGFVPQGAPSSGAVANLVADRTIDQEILKIAERANMTYTRYSDDIVLSGSRDAGGHHLWVNEIIGDVEKALAKYGYRINESKTSIRKQTKRMSVLGLTVNYVVNVRRSEIRRIRAITHNCLKHGFLSQTTTHNHKDAGILYQYLRGKIAYISQISPLKGARLLAELEAAREKHERDFKAKRE